jgi:hypothetical protein
MKGRPLLIPIGLAVALAATAHASDVVLPPLVPKGSTTVRDVANITALISSELDFLPDVSKVIELKQLPPTLNLACLDKPACLGPIAKQGGGTHLLAGSLQMGSSTIILDLVWFDAKTGRTVRRQAFEFPNRSEVIADKMNPVIREIALGERPKQAAAQASAGPSLLDLDDDDDFQFTADDFADAAAAEERRKREAAAADARREAEERTRREAEERTRREAEERARREAEARAVAQREAEARARREAEERARRDAAARTAPAVVADDFDDFDPNAISFGSAPIVVEDEPAPTTRGSAYYTESAPTTKARIVDLDDEPSAKSPSKTAPTTKPARERAASPKPSAGGGSSFDDSPTSVQIALRGGYSPYYRLGFVTYGAEAAIAVGDSGVHIVAGLQGWSVQRDIPERFQTLGGPTTAWNTIFPVNAGVVYKVGVGDGRLRPYGGADLIGAQYYAPDDGSGGKMSFGLRARGGLDYMVARNFGLTADLAVGFWTGKDWEIIERGVKNAGPLPQISAGAVIAF